MAKLFSFKPALKLGGRKFKGLRGWAGKPNHPPLTDIPVAAYVFVGGFDLVSYLSSGSLAAGLYEAAHYVLIGGAAVSVLTALTGFWDWWKSTPANTQAWRTVNAHMAIMLTVTALVVADIVLRIGAWDASAPSTTIMVLSVLAAILVAVGATYGGELVYDFGFNVETAGDSPVWHESEIDLEPGQEGYPAAKP